MNSSCRILALSTAPDQALAFIASLRALVIGPGEKVLSASTAYHPTTRSAFSSPCTVPWVITNKYYTADVYFEVHDVQAWCEDGSGLGHALPHADSLTVPALIYVWTRGEAYREHVQSVARVLARLGLEVDVALAVRLSGQHGSESGDRNDEQIEDDGFVDEFLSSQGFEFIDARPSTPTPDGSHQDIVYEAIPRLPRVVDALSTIMWSSMRARTDTSRTNAAATNGLLDWASRPRHNSARASGTQEELDALERWLTDDSEADVSGKGDPWAHAGVAITMSSSTEEGTRTPLAMRFDDDFTVFVSSPAQEKSREKLTFDDENDGIGDDTLVSESGYGYRALGSASDFGDEEHQQENVKGSDKDKNGVGEGGDEDEDGDLPTREEIRATSARIFSAAVLANFDPAKMPVQGDTNGSYDLASLDLSQVVSTLEGMKAEISEMHDERERRRAAARVALGLVYGLERDQVQE